MRYFSTKNKTHHVTFREAVRNGLAPDGGLYFPESIPRLSNDFFIRLPGLSLSEIGIEVLRPFVEQEIDDATLKSILDNALNFPIPIVKVQAGIYAMELFHGPTLAFKDVGARVMGQILPHYLDDRRQAITVLVATSGDTGSAVAHGFYRVPDVRVVVLYPKGKVSELQEKQFATLGENIQAVAVTGTFDDCQRLVKEAFVDDELNDHLTLTSANSINIARWLPQSLYYFLARSVSDKPTISVPSGNLGNLTAGILAQHMGLQLSHFIAACNANDVVPQYMQSGVFNPKASVETVANAMDVGNPSNFDRLLALYDHDYHQIQQDLSAVSYSDDQILYTIQSCYNETGYLLDPHGATAYQALVDSGREGVFLATAHPAKFGDVYHRLKIDVEMPPSLLSLLDKTVTSVEIPGKLVALKELLLRH